MTRRDALALLLTTTAGATVFGARRCLAASDPAEEPVAPPAPAGEPLTEGFLDEVAETILPATADSPGARAAGVGAFMLEIVRDFYDADERAEFARAPQVIAAAATARFGRGFADLAPVEREAVLLDLERAQPSSVPYQMVKQLAVWGYFSSEVGATQALAHQPIPLAYHGCLPLQPGQRAWAE